MMAALPIPPLVAKASGNSDLNQVVAASCWCWNLICICFLYVDVLFGRGCH